MRRPAILLGIGATALSVTTLRWSALHWGATAEETRDELPGDGIIRDPGLVATRAVTIEAPPEDVWPWVAQVGSERGGFYSYDWLENLAGCRVSSAERVVEGWQHLAVGDVVRLHPKVGLTVASVQPRHSLVLHAAAAPGDDVPYDFTWAFVLLRTPHAATRLVVRERFLYTHPWSFLLVEPVSAASSLMSRKMLRGIRDRVERAPRDWRKGARFSSPA